MMEYLTSIISPLLSEPDVLRIVESEDEKGKLLTVHTSRADMPRIIGKGGETVKAIRLLMHIKGAQTNDYCGVKIAEPVGGKFYKT